MSNSNDAYSYDTNTNTTTEPFIGNVVKKSQASMNIKTKKGGSSLAGRDFNYTSAIRTPGELGMSSAGNMVALGADIAGLINYTEVLVSGTGRALKKKLGNQYFLKTLGKCRLNGRETTRYLYINNVPTGNIKFGGVSISGGRGSMRGLVPGMIENIGKINPLAMFKAFSEGTPDCIRCPRNVCPVTEGRGNMPISKSDYKEVKETFQNMKSKPLNIEENTKNEKNESLNSVYNTLLNNKVAVSYNTGLSLVAAYIVYCLLVKK